MRTCLLLLIVCLLLFNPCRLHGEPLEICLRVLSDPQTDWNTRRLAASAIAAHGTNAFDPLQQLLLHRDPNIHAGARLAFLETGADTIPFLTTLLETVPASRKVSVINSLSDFGGRAIGTAPRLMELIAADDRAVADAASRALIKIGKELDVTNDEIILKSGMVMRGVITSSDNAAGMLAFASFEKRDGLIAVVETVFTADDVASRTVIEEQYRPVLTARLYAYKQRQHDTSDVSVAEVETIRHDGLQYNVYSSDSFLIESTAPADFIAQASLRLRAMTNAYEDFFSAPVAPGTKLKIGIFGTQKEYEEMFRRMDAPPVKNPAFYIPDKNIILGYCDLEQWRQTGREVFERHKIIQDQIDEIQSTIHKAEMDMEKQAREIKDKIAAEVKQVNRNLATLESRQRIEATSKLKTWQREQETALKRAVHAVKMEINKAQAQLAAYHEEIAALNTHNQNILERVAGRMYAMLAHEAFHAFFNNRIRSAKQPPAAALWLEEGLAMCFEAAPFDGVTLLPGGPNPDWIGRLQGWQNDGSLLPLKELLRGTSGDFIVQEDKQTDRSQRFYLQSWYLVRLLAEEGRLGDPGAIRQYITAITARVPGETAFAELAGLPLNDAQLFFSTCLQVDDKQRYHRMTFANGKGPEGRDHAVARILMRSEGSIRILMRNGTQMTLGEADLLDTGDL